MWLAYRALQALLLWYLALVAIRLVLAMLGRKRSPKDKSLLVIFGSGGHTTEMLLMLQTLDPNKYGRVHFVIGHSDTWSLTKINDFFKTQAKFKIKESLQVGRQVTNISVH